jgi:hypothetical protein
VIKAWNTASNILYSETICNGVVNNLFI